MVVGGGGGSRRSCFLASSAAAAAAAAAARPAVAPGRTRRQPQWQPGPNSPTRVNCHRGCLAPACLLQVSCLIELVQNGAAVAHHLWVLLFPIVWSSLQKDQQVGGQPGCEYANRSSCRAPAGLQHTPSA